MDLDRRSFTLTAGAAALTGLAGGPAWSQAAPRFVRRDVYATGAGAPPLAAYRTAVAAMKTRRADDPTSWMFQANIHGTYDTPTLGTDDARAIWNSCQHGSWHFLSWHRVYLYYFERILRTASGRADFALPYWNYARTSRRALPEAFRTPTTGNALFVAARNDGSDPDPRLKVNVNRGDSLPASVVDATRALDALRFGGASGIPPGFTGLLEGQPHNIIHVVLGGDGLMSDPATAAQDPIFWLHHANIDRLWNRWASQAGHAAPSDPAWADRKWTFYDESGAKVELSGRQVLNTATQLDYRYDDEPVQPAPPAAGPTEAASAPPTPVATAEAIALNRSAEVTATLRPLPTEAGRVVAPESGAPTFLLLEGFDYRGRQSTWYEVYLNAPAGAALKADGPYFAGNLALFGLAAHHAGAEPARVVFEVGDVLRRQRRDRIWQGGEVGVRFVPRGPRSATEAATPAPRIGSIRLLQ